MSTREQVLARLASCAWIDDPIIGPVVPDTFAGSSPAWPGSDRWSAIQLVRSIEALPRTVDELLFVPADAGDEPVPVAIVWDSSDVMDVARVYYDKEFIGGPGSDVVRSPIIPPDPHLELHPTIAAVLPALCNNDRETAAGFFAKDFRATMHYGRYIDTSEDAPDFAARVAGESSGVHTTVGAATDDGTSTALEFTAWRTPPHCGMVIFDRSRAGLITDLRTYEGPQPVDLRALLTA